MDYRDQQPYKDAVDMQQYLRWQHQQQAATNNEMVIDPQLLEHDRKVLETVVSWPNSEESNLSLQHLEEDVDRGEPDVEMSELMSAGPSQFSVHTLSSTNEQGPWQYPRTPKHRYQTRHSYNTLQQPTPESSNKSQERPQNPRINQGYDEAWQHGNAFAALSHVESQGYHTPVPGDAAYERCLTPVSQDHSGLEFSAADNGSLSALAEAPTYHPYRDDQHLTAEHEHLSPANFHLWGPQNVAATLPSENIGEWATGTYQPAHVRDTVAEIPEHRRTEPGKGKGKAQASVARSSRSGQSSRSSGTIACPGCDKTFDTKTGMKHHARIHEEKTKECRYCPQRYHFQNHLDRHERTHVDEWPFRCNHPDCTKRYKRSDHLRRHQLKRHGLKAHNALQ